MPLCTRVARFRNGLVAMFGDFEIAPLAAARLGLFHLGEGRFNGFRVGFRYAALEASDMPIIAAHPPSARLGSARLLREEPKAIVEMDSTNLRAARDGRGAMNMTGIARTVLGAATRHRPVERRIASLRFSPPNRAAGFYTGCHGARFARAR